MNFSKGKRIRLNLSFIITLFILSSRNYVIQKIKKSFSILTFQINGIDYEEIRIFAQEFGIAFLINDNSPAYVACD